MLDSLLLTTTYAAEVAANSANAVLAPVLEDRAPWHVLVLDVLLEIGIVVIAISIALCVLRLLRGPHLADRAIAIDAIAVQLAALVVLFTLRVGELVFFDGVLVLSLIGFAGTVAVAQYIIRRARRRETREVTS